MAKKSNAGRPTVMTPSVLDILKQAFMFGCTDEQACLYAEISPDALYKYQRENPEYIKKKELFKENPVLLARQSVITSMQEDGNLALKFLERKCKEEFSPRSELTGKDGEDFNFNITKVIHNARDNDKDS